MTVQWLERRRRVGVGNRLSRIGRLLPTRGFQVLFGFGKPGPGLGRMLPRRASMYPETPRTRESAVNKACSSEWLSRSALACSRPGWPIAVKVGVGLASR